MAFLNPEAMFYGKVNPVDIFHRNVDYSSTKTEADRNTVPKHKEETLESNINQNDNNTDSTQRGSNLCLKLKTWLIKERFYRHRKKEEHEKLDSGIKPLVLMTSFTTFVTSIFNTTDKEKIPRRLSFNRKVATILAQDPSLKFFLHLENRFPSPGNPLTKEDEERRFNENEVANSNYGTKSGDNNHSKVVVKMRRNQENVNKTIKVTDLLREITKTVQVADTKVTVDTVKVARLKTLQQGFIALQTSKEQGFRNTEEDGKKTTTELTNTNENPPLSPFHRKKIMLKETKENSSHHVDHQFNHGEGSVFKRVSPQTPAETFISKAAEDQGQTSAENGNDNDEGLPTNDEDKTESKNDAGWLTPPVGVVEKEGTAVLKTASLKQQQMNDDHKHQSTNDFENLLPTVNKTKPKKEHEARDDDKQQQESIDKNNTLFKLSVRQSQTSSKEPESNPITLVIDGGEIQSKSSSHSLLRQEEQQHRPQQQQQQQKRPKTVNKSSTKSSKKPKTKQTSNTHKPSTVVQTTNLNSKLTARSEQLEQRAASPFEAIVIALNDTTNTNTKKVLDWKVHKIQQQHETAVVVEGNISPTSSSATSSPFETIYSNELSENNEDASSSSSFEDIYLP